MQSTLKNHQYALLAYLMGLVFKVAMLPSLIAGTARDDLISVIVLLLALDMLQLFLVYGVSCAGGVSGITQKMRKPVIIALLSVILLVTGYKLLIYFAEIVNYVSRYMFSNTADYPITIIIVLVLGYLAMKGGRTLGRIAGFMLWFLPVMLAAGLVFGRVTLRFDYLLPLFGGGARPVFTAFDKYIMWSCSFLPLMFVGVKREKLNFVPLAGVALVLSVAGFYAVFAASYGRAAYLMENAFARLASSDGGAAQASGLSMPATAVWLIVAVVALAMRTHSAAAAGALVGVRSEYAAAAFVLVIGILSLFVIKTMAVAAAWATSVARYIVLAAEILLPAGLLVLRREN